MAISIVNVNTAQSTGVNNSSLTIPLAATSVGSTLIVLVSTENSGGSTAGIDSIQDDQGNPGFYTFESGSSTSFTNGGVGFVTNTIYRTSVPAGLTFVTVSYAHSQAYVTATVLEVQGVNVATPVTTSNSKITTSVGTFVGGNNTSAAFANSLFVNVTICINNLTTTDPNSTWTRTFTTTNSRYKQGYKIATTAQLATWTLETSGTTTSAVSTTVFNPTANSFTLNLNEGVTTSDSLVDEASYERSLGDTLSLSDFIDYILSANLHFKSLFETIVLADSFSKVWTVIRLLSDAVLLTDNISLMHDAKRTLNETIRVQDWVELKHSSDQWSS